MARKALAGGYVSVEIGVGKDQLEALDVARARHGWSRAEWFRRASAALLRADLEALERAKVVAVSHGDDDEGEAAGVELDAAVDDLDDPEDAVTFHSGAITPRGASAMGRGRWSGWYPQDLTDAEVVADLRRLVTGGTVYLRRPRLPDAMVHAYADPPGVVARSAKLGFSSSPFYRVIGPDDVA